MKPDHQGTRSAVENASECSSAVTFDLKDGTVQVVGKDVLIWAGPFHGPPADAPDIVIPLERLRLIVETGQQFIEGPWS